MSEPFLAEIRIVGFNFAPRGYANCDGQILPITQNQSLFSLLGTTYGGDGRSNFALPDLRGRTPIHAGQGPSLSNRNLGSKGGGQSHTLQVNEMPQHQHQAMASSTDGDAPVPNGFLLARSVNQPYIDPAGQILADLRAGTIANAGAFQGHANEQPYLALNFVIALAGLFPSRN